MTSSLGFYVKPKHKHSPGIEDGEFLGNDEDDQDFENAEYLQEVPYTSSSVDRSSIGSIPWADDAIKVNQLEWENVEKMLAGLETLPEDEDLRNEISDWQKKFPHMLGKKLSYKINARSKHTLDMMESLDLDSDEEDLDVDGKGTQTRDRINNRISSGDDISIIQTPPTRKSTKEGGTDLCQLLQNFTLTSVPYKLSQRETTKLSRRKCSSSSSSHSLRSPPAPMVIPIAHPTVQRLRMPPILNVLETTRKFRNLAGHGINPSFVQLTQVQQAKSAVSAQDKKFDARLQNGHRSAWHLPLTANRFFNNRNSIILPAISSRQQVVHQYNTHPKTTNSTSSEVGTTNTTPSSTRENVFRNNINKFATHNTFTAAVRHRITGGFSSNGSTTQTNTSNSGRSISAAVQYPRPTFNALYLPYSASKFHAFK